MTRLSDRAHRLRRRGSRARGTAGGPVRGRRRARRLYARRDCARSRNRDGAVVGEGQLRRHDAGLSHGRRSRLGGGHRRRGWLGSGLHHRLHRDGFLRRRRLRLRDRVDRRHVELSGPGGGLGRGRRVRDGIRGRLGGRRLGSSLLRLLDRGLHRQRRLRLALRRLLHRRFRLERRQERQRVHVAVRVRGDADAEMDVWLRRDGVGSGTAYRDDGAFVDERSAESEELAQLEQRDRPAVVGPDGDRLPSAGHRPRERHRAGGRRADGRAGLGADVDAAVLPARVRIVSERERTQDRAGHRPGPAVRRRRDDERGHGREQDSAHLPTPRSVEFEQFVRR